MFVKEQYAEMVIEKRIAGSCVFKKEGMTYLDSFVEGRTQKIF